MTTMTDQEIKDHAYECGFYGTTFFHLDQLTVEQRELWDAYFEEGRSDERDEAAAANADWHTECSVYGYDD